MLDAHICRQTGDCHALQRLPDGILGDLGGRLRQRRTRCVATHCERWAMRFSTAPRKIFLPGDSGRVFGAEVSA